MDAGPELKQLLGDFDPAVFLDEYWDRRSLYSPGKVERFRALSFDLAAFRKAAERAGDTQNIAASYPDGQGVFREFIAHPRQIEYLFGSGMSLCFGSVDGYHSELASFASGFRRRLHHAGRVQFNAYLSPAHRGFDVHFDSRSVFAIQVEGSKLWRYSEDPGVRHPPIGIVLSEKNNLRNFRIENPWAEIEPPKDSELVETLMTPGDVLYIPPGAWHATSASGSGYSLGLSLTCSPMNFATLAAEALKRLFSDDPEWRRALPLTTADAGTNGSPIEHFFAARLEELRRRIEDLDASTVAQAWRSSLGLVGAGESEVEDELETRVERSDVLVVPNSISWEEGVDEDGDPAVLIFCVDRSVAMGRDALPFVRELARQQRFVAESAMAWRDSDPGYSWEEVREALSGLLASDVVRRVR